MVSGIVMSGPERKRDYRISLPIAQGPHRPLQEVSRLILSMISKPRLGRLALEYRQNLTSVLGESIPLRTFFKIALGSRSTFFKIALRSKSPIEVSCPEPDGMFVNSDRRMLGQCFSPSAPRFAVDIAFRKLR